MKSHSEPVAKRAFDDVLPHLGELIEKCAQRLSEEQEEPCNKTPQPVNSELVHKFREIRARYESADANTVSDVDAADDDETIARLWAPWTPWVCFGSGVRMMRASDYGPDTEVRDQTNHAAILMEAASLAADDEPDGEVARSVLHVVEDDPKIAVRRFAPRGGTVFALDDVVTIQCRDLPVSDHQFELVLNTDSVGSVVVSGSDSAWQEFHDTIPEKKRDVRWILHRKKASEWLDLLGCDKPAADETVEIHFTFVANNGLDWASGESFRITGKSWLGLAEQDVTRKCWAWNDVIGEAADRLRYALEAAQWGESVTSALVRDLESLQYGPLCEPVRKAMLYYWAGLDCLAVRLVRQTPETQGDAGDLLRVIGLLCEERNGCAEPMEPLRRFNLQ